MMQLQLIAFSIGRRIKNPKCYPLNANNKGATGFDRDARVKEACRVTAYPKLSGTNITADSNEYALAA